MNVQASAGFKRTEQSGPWSSSVHSTFRTATSAAARLKALAHDIDTDVDAVLHGGDEAGDSIIAIRDLRPHFGLGHRCVYGRILAAHLRGDLVIDASKQYGFRSAPINCATRYLDSCLYIQDEDGAVCEVRVPAAHVEDCAFLFVNGEGRFVAMRQLRYIAPELVRVSPEDGLKSFLTSVGSRHPVLPQLSAQPESKFDLDPRDQGESCVIDGVATYVPAPLSSLAGPKAISIETLLELVSTAAVPERVNLLCCVLDLDLYASPAVARVVSLNHFAGQRPPIAGAHALTHKLSVRCEHAYHRRGFQQRFPPGARVLLRFARVVRPQSPASGDATTPPPVLILDRFSDVVTPINRPAIAAAALQLPVSSRTAEQMTAVGVRPVPPLVVAHNTRSRSTTDGRGDMISGMPPFELLLCWWCIPHEYRGYWQM